jgi:hypothetical protein
LVPAIKCITLSSLRDIAIMPAYESTLGYIDLAPFDSDEEHSSQSPLHGAMRCIIDLTRSDSEGGENLEEHRVVVESVESERL